MRGISLRLIFGHALVALLAVGATYLIVRWQAPALFDEELRLRILAETGRSDLSGRVPGVGLRGDFERAVNQALILGAIVGTIIATAAGLLVSLRVGGSLRSVRAATRQMAAGDYGVSVPIPPETELAEIAQDVNTLGRELAQIEARRTRLLGEVAHEMRTPLTVIDGYVECMIDGVLPPDEETLGYVSGETKKLRRLADDISTLSRTEEGRLTVERHGLDLRDVVRDAAERLRPQTEHSGLTLRVVTDDRAVEVAADADRLAQVVTNLLGNSLAATPPGGTVTVTTGVQGDDAVVTVTDTGEGLADDHLDRIFERFYRVPGRRSTGSESGSGIGLTIARGIARLHDGDLVASSPGPGLGATFTLTLPLIRTASGTRGS